MKSDQNRLKSDQNHDLIRFYLEVWSDLIRLFIFLNVFHFFLFFPSPKNEIWSKQVKPDQYHVFFCKLFFPLFLQKVSFHLGKRQPFNVSKLFFHCLAIKNISAWKKQFGIIDLKKNKLNIWNLEYLRFVQWKYICIIVFQKNIAGPLPNFTAAIIGPRLVFATALGIRGQKKTLQSKRNAGRIDWGLTLGQARWATDQEDKGDGRTACCILLPLRSFRTDHISEGFTKLSNSFRALLFHFRQGNAV